MSIYIFETIVKKIMRLAFKIFCRQKFWHRCFFKNKVSIFGCPDFKNKAFFCLRDISKTIECKFDEALTCNICKHIRKNKIRLCLGMGCAQTIACKKSFS